MDTNDNSHDAVQQLRERLDAAQALRASLVAQATVGTLMAEGKQWRSQGRGTAGNTAPHASNDPILSVAMDHIGPIVRQTDGRLRVDDFSAVFTTVENELVGLESPELSQKLRLIQGFHWRWQPRANPSEWYNDLSHRRVVCGWCAKRARFADAEPGIRRTNGLLLDPGGAVNLTTDPANLSPDLNDHIYLINAEAIPVAVANRDYAEALKKKGAYPLESGTTMGQLVPGDPNLGVAAGLAPGAASSNTPAVVRYEMWDDWYERITVILYVPRWKTKADNGYGRVKEEEKGDAWFVVQDDEKWLYGNLWLKLDHFRRASCAYGQSLAVALTPMQNLVNVMTRTEVRSALQQGMNRLLVLKGALEASEHAKLASNAPIEILNVNRGATLNNVLYPIQMPRFDAAADAIRQQATGTMYRQGVIEPVAMGQTQSRQPTSSQSLALDQALVPLDAISQTDHRRTETWLANVHDAALRHHLGGSPRKYVVMLYGKQWANLALASRKRLDKIINAGPVACHMRDAAFRPETPLNRERRLFDIAQAGHLDLKDPTWAREFFLQTGREIQKGQAELYDNALDIVRAFLDGQEVDIGPNDAHEFIAWICRHFLGVSRLRGYTIKQKQALEGAILRCDEHQAMLAAYQAANTGQTQALAGSGGLSAPAGPTTGPTTLPQPAGAPMVGELAPAAAG